MTTTYCTGAATTVYGCRYADDNTITQKTFSHCVHVHSSTVPVNVKEYCIPCVHFCNYSTGHTRSSTMYTLHYGSTVLYTAIQTQNAGGCFLWQTNGWGKEENSLGKEPFHGNVCLFFFLFLLQTLLKVHATRQRLIFALFCSKGANFPKRETNQVSKVL